MKFIGALIISIIFIQCNVGQKKDLEAVLFSEDGAHVLAYDYYLKTRENVDAWNLYSTDRDVSKLSLIKKGDEFHIFDQELWRDSSLIEIGKEIDIDSLRDVHGLYLAGEDISSLITCSVKPEPGTDMKIAVKKLDNYDHVDSQGMTVEWLHSDDSILKYAIDSIPNSFFDETITKLEQTLKTSRASEVLAEDGFLMGWRNQYSAVYRSIDNKYYFIEANLLSTKFSGESAGKVSDYGDSQTVTSYRHYESVTHEIRIIKEKNR